MSRSALLQFITRVPAQYYTLFLIGLHLNFRKVVASAANTEVCNALGIKDSFLLCLIIETAIAFCH